jgi:hypothetical protein
MTRKYNRRLVIAVDLDKTIASYDGWKDIYTFGQPLPGAREFLKELHEFGDIIIHSCRCSPSVVSKNTAPFLLANMVKDWLNTNNLIYDTVWFENGKPNADIFIDDKGLRVPENPTPENYEETLKNVKEIFGIGD